MRTFLLSPVGSILVAIAMLSGSAFCQNTQNSTTVEGTVVSASRQTLVVKTDDNDFQLFVFDHNTQKPKTMAVGSRVRVVSTPGEEQGTRLASEVAALESPSAPATSASNTSNSGTTQMRAMPPPPAVENVEQNIKSDARRFHLGVRAGAALDPELFMFGVHSQMGPIFNKNVFFRPNADFAFGEVTDLIALNLEAIYRLPVTARDKSWWAYLGAGPGFTFLHQNFERQQGQGRDIDFGNFDFGTGFNILAGIQKRHTFYEMKTSLYARPAPTLQLIVGYTF